MEILKASVDWMERYDNAPQLKVLVDKIPPKETRHYRTLNDKGTLYYSETEGYVSFYHYERPGEGFGGAHIPIIMEDGTSTILKGPWSSRSGCMNRFLDSPCTEVSITDTPKVWEQGFTYFGGAINFEKACEAAKLANVWLATLIDDTGEIVLEPTLRRSHPKRLGQERTRHEAWCHVFPTETPWYNTKLRQTIQQYELAESTAPDSKETS